MKFLWLILFCLHFPREGATNSTDSSDGQDGSDYPSDTTTSAQTTELPVTHTADVTEPTVTAYANETDPTEDYYDHDRFDSHLTDEAREHLTNGTNMTHFTANVTTQDEKREVQYVGWEWWHDLRHFASENAYLRVCYYLTTTYRNAMRDLRKYYQIRYLYYDNVEYEIGYVTHEIIFKYQIVLELYHLIQRKFEFQQTRMVAPITYMLYIYTNILFQCTDIIHLCNMLHEIEAKYKNYKSKGPFADFAPKEKKSLARDSEDERDKAIEEYQKKLERMEKRIQSLEKKRMKMIEKGKFVMPTKRTTRTYKKVWDLDYGWSIEFW